MVKEQLIFLAALILVGATACGPTIGESSTTPEPPVGEGLPQVTQAQNDLAQRLGLPAEQIEVVEVQEMTWPDTSMGCPQPGMEYLQVPQDGLLVRMRVAEAVYDYHSGGNREPFLCEQPAVEEKVTPVFGEDILTRPSPEGE